MPCLVAGRALVRRTKPLFHRSYPKTCFEIPQTTLVRRLLQRGAV